MPARMSGLSIRCPTSCAGPVTTARCGSQRMMRAPIEPSLSVKNRRVSNIFSNIRTVPNACVATVTAIEVRSDGNAGHGPSSIFGIAPPRSSCTINCWRAGTCTVSSPISTRTPSRPNAGMIESRSFGRTASIVTSPPLIAAMPMKLPTSMWSGPIAHSPPPSESTPWMRSTLDSMPSICAPSDTRKRHKSCTCGSQAALPITVSPGEVTAAITAFSVAMTLASSRKTCAPRSPGVVIRNDGPPMSIAAPSSAKAWMCGSRRRRPITSPPGGGIVASPKRASSGPASRNDARILLQSRSSGADFSTAAVCTRTSFGPIHSASAPRSASSSSIVSTSRMRGMFVSVTGSFVSRHAARIGNAPFLLPAARMRPPRGCPPSMTNASAMGGATAMAGYASQPVEPTRTQAWETLTKYTKSESLLRHALAVEASTAAYARKLGGDEETWRVAALLHDFDYEMHPTLDKHPQDGAPILREEGYPEEIVDAVLSHAEHLALPRDTPLKKALFACDELSGFVHACALVRPTGLEGLEPKSVKQKLKQPSFAAGVHREDVYKGAEELGVELDDHIRTVVEALQPIAAELGLAR